MSSDILIGHTIGAYRILDKIGQGGMAEVYKGYHPALERYVAIKVLGRSLQVDPAFSRRFRREAQAAASLRHPNIIHVYDFGSFRGGHYIVMEYVEGNDLRIEMERRKFERRPFTPNEILNILGQVADALDHAHQQGIIHRDIKPANILLAPEDQVILTDFGLAMLRDRVSQLTLGHSFGTPEYIAPEQAIDSRAAVPQSDIYALGAILYEIVTGRPPFSAESPISLALMHVNEEPTPPRQYAPYLPPAVEAVILKALAKEPQARFPTAQAMIEALRLGWTQKPVAAEQETVQATRPAESLSPTPPPPTFQPTGPVQPLPGRVALPAPAGPAQPLPGRAAPPSPAGMAQPIPPPVALPAQPVTTPPAQRQWLTIAGLATLFVVVVSGFFAVLISLRNRGLATSATATPTTVPIPTALSTVAAVVLTQMPTRTPVPSPYPSLTPAPSATPTTAPSAAPTTTPSAIPTATPTPTALPTATPVATDTPLPTSAPMAGPIEVRSADGMAMRFVPGGPFLMGTDDDPDAFSHEGPQHEITLSPFWMDATEASNAQYRMCVEAGGCEPPKTTTYYDDPAWDDHPVVYVTWEYADAYCRWLAGETGWNVHLPTEAEWEKAASWDPIGETKRRYPWGDDDPDAVLLNYLGSGLGRTATVGSYPRGASAYGVLDMAGNVWEWVADWYDGNYYRTANLPPDPTGPVQGSQRVMRGGSYGFGSRQARTTHRDAGSVRANGAGLGFRCAVGGETLP